MRLGSGHPGQRRSAVVHRIVEFVQGLRITGRYSEEIHKDEDSERRHHRTGRKVSRLDLSSRLQKEEGAGNRLFANKQGLRLLIAIGLE